MSESTQSPPAVQPTVGYELAHGWRTLLATTIGFAAGISSMVFLSTGLFIPELTATFGWSLGDFATLNLIANLIIVVVSPLVGIAVDRYGSHLPVTFSLAVVAVALVCLSFVGPNFVVYASIWSLMFLLGAFTISTPFSQAVCVPFHRLRGTALGIMLAGGGLAAILVPALLGTRIAEDWRSGYVILGIVALVGAVIYYVAMIGQASARPVASRQSSASLAAAMPYLRTGLFARITIALALIALAVGGLTLYLVTMLRDSGASVQDAATAASMIGVALLIGRIFTGLLIDRFFAPYVATVVMVAAAAGLLSLVLWGPAMGIVAGLAVGLSLGSEVDLMAYLLSRYFGLRVLGRMSGILLMLFVVAIACAPQVFEWLHRLSGGYTTPIIVSVVLMLVAAGLLVTLPRFPAVPAADLDEPATQIPDAPKRTA